MGEFGSIFLFSSRERVAAGSSGSVSDGGTFEIRGVIGNQMPA